MTGFNSLLSRRDHYTFRGMVLLKAIPCSQFSAKNLVHFQNKLPNVHVKTKSYYCHAVRVKFIYCYEGKHSPSIKLNSRCR